MVGDHQVGVESPNGIRQGFEAHETHPHERPELLHGIRQDFSVGAVLFFVGDQDPHRAYPTTRSWRPRGCAATALRFLDRLAIAPQGGARKVPEPRSMGTKGSGTERGHWRRLMRRARHARSRKEHTVADPGRAWAKRHILAKRNGNARGAGWAPPRPHDGDTLVWGRFRDRGTPSCRRSWDDAIIPPISGMGNNIPG